TPTSPARPPTRPRSGASTRPPRPSARSSASASRATPSRPERRRARIPFVRSAVTLRWTALPLQRRILGLPLVRAGARAQEREGGQTDRSDLIGAQNLVAVAPARGEQERAQQGAEAGGEGGVVGGLGWSVAQRLHVSALPTPGLEEPRERATGLPVQSALRSS